MSDDNRGGRRTGLRVILAVVGVAVLAAATAGVLYFFRSGTCRPAPIAQHAPPAIATTTTSPPAPKDLDAAIAAAQEKSDRHASGDFAGEWLLYTKDLRDHISQQAFVQYSKTCSMTGLKINVAGGRMDGADRAIVRLEVLGVTKSFTWLYEDGAWYQEPTEFLTSNYGKSEEQLIAADRAEGQCKS